MYKLYDFLDKNKPGFEAELDEQIRLFADVLYNRREIYPNQLSSPSIPIWFNQALWWAFPADNAPGRTLVANTGTTLTRVSSAAEIDLSTTDELATSVSSTISGTAVRYSIVNPLTFSNAIAPSDPFNFGLYLFTRIKLTSITNLRFRVLMGNQSLTNTDNPWSTSATGGGVAFNFLPAVSPNWFAVGKIFSNATGVLNFNVNLGVPVVENQIYNLEIVVTGMNADRRVYFYIDGVLYHTESGNTTYSTYLSSLSGWDLILIPTAAEMKRLGVFNVMWGRRPTVTALPDPIGYLSY